MTTELISYLLSNVLLVGVATMKSGTVVCGQQRAVISKEAAVTIAGVKALTQGGCLGSELSERLKFKLRTK